MNQGLRYPLIGIGVRLVLRFIPILFFGEDVYVHIHDNLEAEHLYFHLMKEQGILFDAGKGAVMEGVMNGIPRQFFRSGFTIIGLLYWLFPSFWAYQINDLLIRFLAFLFTYEMARGGFGLENRKSFLLALIYTVLRYSPFMVFPF
jgi:hypothetical protein